MSWFETTAIASIAKNALKEAQKTIDKALDIKEQELSKTDQTINSSLKINAKKDTQKFFSSFGLSEDSAKLKPSATDGDLASHLTNDPSGGMVGSLWGSFTGSFFENQKASDAGFSNTSSAPETPSDSIIKKQPPRTLSELGQPTSESNSSSSIIQLSADAVSPTQEEPHQSVPANLNFTPTRQGGLESKGPWEWDEWANNNSSIMVISSELQLEESESFISDAEEGPEESLADDSLDHDGFASSRLVVKSVESDRTLRHESLGSLASTKSQADNDPLQIVNEEFFSDPFEEDSAVPILQIGKDTISKADDSSSVSFTFNTPNSPDSIITLPSMEASPIEEEHFDVPKNQFPSNGSGILQACSPDSVEIFDSNGGATSSSIEVLSLPTSMDSPSTNLDLQSNEKKVDLEVSSIENPLILPTSNPDKEHDIPAITKQPLASVLPQTFNRCVPSVSPSSPSVSPSSVDTERVSTSSQFDGSGVAFLEDSSTCDSVHSASTSSTLTALDTSISGQDTMVSSFPDSLQNVESAKETFSSKNGEQKQSESDEFRSLNVNSDLLRQTPDCAINEDSQKPCIRTTSQSGHDDYQESCLRTEDNNNTDIISLSSKNDGSDSLSSDGEMVHKEDLTLEIVRAETEVLIQEAMVDDKKSSTNTKEQKEEMQSTNQEREQSPNSSDKSDLLKTNSEHASEQSSADEVDTGTATSSDIEVISSPSMDGSNGNTRGFVNPSIASKIWNTTHRGFKSFLHETTDPSTSNSTGKRDNSNNGLQDKAETVPSSMTTSITSISESEGEGFVIPTTEFLQMESSRISQVLLKEFNSYEKGHRRNQSNISETSESSSEPQSPEMDKLIKKLSHLTEVLQARETKLLELSHSNASLQDANHSLKLRLEEMEDSKKGMDSPESVREEFTQRLVAMERKFQQALREKEAAKKQLEECKLEAASMLTSSQIFRDIEEKDIVIKELREEGAKLSRQERQHLNTIKKLRTKEKETDACIKTQKEKIETQCHEVERLQKQLTAKEEVERNQIDAIRRFTMANDRQEVEIKELKSSTAELEGKCITLKDALESTYREISDLKRAAAERDAEAQELALSAEVAARQNAEQSLAEIQLQNTRDQEALFAQIHELQESLGRAEMQANRKERQLKADISDLQMRLAESETRCEELSNAVSAATRPLLRQMENLQSSHAVQQQTWESLEDSLTKRLTDAQNAVALSTEKERGMKEQHMAFLSELTNLQAQVSSYTSENAELKSKLQELTSKTSQLEESKIRESSQMEALKTSFAEEIAEVKHERDLLEQQLEIERTALSAEKKKNQLLQEQSKEKERKYAQQQEQILTASIEDINRSTHSSPTPSLSRISTSDSMVGSQWGDDVFESSWPSARTGTLYDSLRTNSAVTVEVLTATLRQREGELHTVQTELTRHEAQKESLAHELVETSEKVQRLESMLRNQEELQKRLIDVEQRYNALLQMYGEKVEEVEELRLDLADVKEMYKAQINELLQK